MSKPKRRTLLLLVTLALLVIFAFAAEVARSEPGEPCYPCRDGCGELGVCWDGCCREEC